MARKSKRVKRIPLRQSNLPKGSKMTDSDGKEYKVIVLPNGTHVWQVVGKWNKRKSRSAATRRRKSVKRKSRRRKSVKRKSRRKSKMMEGAGGGGGKSPSITSILPPELIVKIVSKLSPSDLTNIREVPGVRSTVKEVVLKRIKKKKGNFNDDFIQNLNYLIKEEKDTLKELKEIYNDCTNSSVALWGWGAEGAKRQISHYRKKIQELKTKLQITYKGGEMPPYLKEIFKNYEYKIIKCSIERLYYKESEKMYKDIIDNDLLKYLCDEIKDCPPCPPAYCCKKHPFDHPCHKCKY
jgi:hypothetical protein